MTSWKAALFSAIVGAFIIESYKKLSPDTGSQTVVLLRQISQQLTMNGTSPNPSVDQPFTPSAPILWVNGMWLTSLVLSVASALYSTLLQEWARTYTQIPQLSMRLSHRARVTSFLFFSLTKYNITFAALTAQGLLHVSVFCFFHWPCDILLYHQQDDGHCCSHPLHNLWTGVLHADHHSLD